MKKEKVLVFPADLIKNFDFSNKIVVSSKEINKIYNEIINSPKLFYMDRVLAEKNSNFKQLIPYCVLANERNNFFCYKRTSKGNEKRLHNLWSLGIGGHINPIDGNENNISYSNGFERELQEEIGIRVECCQSINDVGKVHFGIVHFVKLLSNTAINCKDQSLSQGSFENEKIIKKSIESFESWSQLIIKNIL